MLDVIPKNDGRNQYIDYSRDSLRCHFKCEVSPDKVRKICGKTDLSCSLGVVWDLSEPGQLECVAFDGPLTASCGQVNLLFSLLSGQDASAVLK